MNSLISKKMEVNSTLKLFSDFDCSPFEYWVTSSSTYDTSVYRFKSKGNVTFDPTQDDNGNYGLVLLVVACTSSEEPSHPIEHIVDLGAISSSGSECSVIVDVYCNNARIGGGIVRLATAEQGTRPF